MKYTNEEWMMSAFGFGDRAIRNPHNEGLVSSRVTRRRHNEHSRQHLGLPIEHLIAKALGVDKLRERVIKRVTSSLELDALDYHFSAD